MAHTIKISGVSDELLSLVDRQWRGRHFADRAEYVRELIRKDVMGEATLTSPLSFSQGVKNLFGALHEEIGRKGYSEEEIAADVEDALAQVRAARKPKSPSAAK